MSNERLTWQQIKEKYPHQKVGLVSVEKYPNSNIIKSAIVKYTDREVSRETLCLMAYKGEIIARYTSLDEDDMLGGLSCERI